METWEEIKAWRKARRAELIAQREALSPDLRKQWNETITQHLLDAFDMPDEAVIGFCWPFKAEFDARFAVRRWRALGATAALPEVVDRNAPLQFRAWSPGVAMRPGVYEIPVPENTDIVLPDVAVVPMNGFDARGFRLGYGGGFFDSTLAALGRRTVAIGVSYSAFRLDDIFPQPHDVPMDFIVTEEGVHTGGGEPLQKVGRTQSRTAFATLLRDRRLPRASERTGGYSSPACYAAEFPGYFGEDRNEGK